MSCAAQITKLCICMENIFLLSKMHHYYIQFTRKTTCFLKLLV